MQFFIDSASLSHIEELSTLGLIEGVTTNPSLIAKEGLTTEEELYARYSDICRVAPANVSLEVISSEPSAMLSEAKHLAEISPKAVIKIAMSLDGLSVLRKLSALGIRTNCTLVFTPLQALLAAKAGATYVSPFVGRLDDVHADGIVCVSEIKHIFRQYSFDTKVLAASIRHPYHVLRAAQVGADVVTCPYAVIKALPNHPLTEKGAQLFLSDYQKSIAHATLPTKD